jgi:hypothetical protein
MELAKLVTEMDEMVKQGQILEAVEKYFTPVIQTKDHNGMETSDKKQVQQKLEGFLGGIQKVNSITLHHTATGNQVSMSEFTFDFDMKDGSKVFWHEIIRRIWKDGKVINEQYFKA